MSITMMIVMIVMTTMVIGFRDTKGRQEFKRKNFPDGVRKSFSRHICAKSAKIAFTTYMPKCQNSSYKSARYGCCNNTANNKIFVGKVSRLFGNIPDGLESFQTVRKLSTLSVNFPHCQEISKLSGPNGNFLDHLETF